MPSESCSEIFADFSSRIANLVFRAIMKTVFLMVWVFTVFFTPGGKADVLRFQPAKWMKMGQSILPAISPATEIEPDTSSANEWPPKFCNKLDCPKYTVTETGKGYEKRQYDPASWVGTQIGGVDYDQATYTLFMRLFNYIQGANEKKMKIAMTCPVLVRIIPGPGPACESNFTMWFYMPAKIGTPPKATDKTVFIQSEPQLSSYVRQFSGYATLNDWLTQARQLGEALKGKAHQTDYFYTAGYDAPFKLFNRHNEVMMTALS